ncbi:MAG: hypothetical protein JRF27_03640 [Deltaproteobacteria bacterium]|nr:hypothetical protein [Deltaproteobacteria bacterium]
MPAKKVPRKGVKIRCKICDFEMLLVKKPVARGSAPDPVAMVVLLSPLPPQTTSVP